MALAYASATGSACALQHELSLVVQTPFKASNSNCTSNGSYALTDVITTSLLEDLNQRAGTLLSRSIQSALEGLIASVVAMAEGRAEAKFFLSSLDPGAGKTSAVIHAIRALLRSENYKEVSVLLCFSRLEEITRVVEDIGLNEADFAVMTRDEGTNNLSSTNPNDARVLFTTHSMIRSRCRGRHFADVDDFKFMGAVRSVRVWDEALEARDMVSINTDQLASLKDPLRFTAPALVKLIDEIEETLRSSKGQGTYEWPDVFAAAHSGYRSLKRGLKQRAATYLDNLFALSGQTVLLRKLNNASSVVTALDSRDAIPEDLAPMVILDVSGRIRTLYEQWEKATGMLVRLPTAPMNYSNLVVHLMDKGAGKTAWTDDRTCLSLSTEAARVIDSKPNEEWLVIYHKSVRRGAIPDQIMGLLSSDPDRVRFLNWGKHQGTNDYRHIKNIIIAGLNFYSEAHYEQMARCYSNTESDEQVPMSLVNEIEDGEHMHHLLQALCRASVRQGNGSDCGPCNAYIIAPKRAQMRRLLPKVFPNCIIRKWRPTGKKAKGKGSGRLVLYRDALRRLPG